MIPSYGRGWSIKDRDQGQRGGVKAEIGKALEAESDRRGIIEAGARTGE